MTEFHTEASLASELCEFALSLAYKAGALLSEMASSDLLRLELRKSANTKSSATDLATAADRASETLIVETIRTMRPLDGLLAEEGSAVKSRSGVTWIVDPLDGTTNFLYGIDAYAVSIAAVLDKTTLAGVVHSPERGETFVAERGKGAFLNNHLLAAIEPRATLADALVGTGFGYRADDRSHQARLLPIVLPSVRDIRRSGAAALDLCALSVGRLDAYYESGLKPWDSAAGLLICEEVGLEHRHVDGVVPSGPTLIASSTALADELEIVLRQAANLGSSRFDERT